MCSKTLTMASEEDTKKFMMMFLQASNLIAEQEKIEKAKANKTQAKVFDRDFINKDATEFGGSASEYNDWSFKWRIHMKTSSALVLKVIEEVEGMG